MSDGYTKLFGSIIHSSVWSEPAHVRLVWVTMLALVNQDGLVEAAVPGLASAARVTLDECEDALRVLSSPDKYSRSKAHEGRRVDAVDGGWLLLNHATYRNRLSIEDRRARTAERTRKWRQTHSSESVTLSASHSVTERHQTSLSVTVTECDAGDDMQIQMQKQIQNKPEREVPARVAKAPPKPKVARWRKVPEGWEPTEQHQAIARQLCVDFGLELQKYRDHEFDKPKQDPDSTFRNWLRNAKPAGAGGGGPLLTRGRPATASEDERARARNNLLDDAKAGRAGPKAQAWAESGQDLGKLADKLEDWQRKRENRQLSQQMAPLLEGVGR